MDEGVILYDCKIERLCKYNTWKKRPPPTPPNNSRSLRALCDSNRHGARPRGGVTNAPSRRPQGVPRLACGHRRALQPGQVAAITSALYSYSPAAAQPAASYRAGFGWCGDAPVGSVLAYGWDAVAGAGVWWKCFVVAVRVSLPHCVHSGRPTMHPSGAGSSSSTTMLRPHANGSSTHTKKRAFIRSRSP